MNIMNFVTDWLKQRAKEKERLQEAKKKYEEEKAREIEVRFKVNLLWSHLMNVAHLLYQLGIKSDLSFYELHSYKLRQTRILEYIDAVERQRHK